MPTRAELPPADSWPTDRDGAARDLLDHLPSSLLDELWEESLSLDRTLAEIGPILARRTGILHGNRALREDCVRPFAAGLGILLRARERALDRGWAPGRRSWRLGPDAWPRTLSDACEEILRWLPEPHRARLADEDGYSRESLEEDLAEVVALRYSVAVDGAGRRNEALIRSCEQGAPASLPPAQAIVQAVGERLRAHPARGSDHDPGDPRSLAPAPPVLLYSDSFDAGELGASVAIPPDLETAAEEVLSWELPCLAAPDHWGSLHREWSPADDVVGRFRLYEGNEELLREGTTPLACILVIARRAELLVRNDRLPREPMEPGDEWMLGPADWPLDLDAAARDLIRWVDPDERPVLRELSDEQLGGLHFGLGMGVRNRQGLWRGNEALLEDCSGGFPGGTHPDDASGVIISRARELLRTEEE